MRAIKGIRRGSTQDENVESELQPRLLPAGCRQIVFLLVLSLPCVRAHQRSNRPLEPTAESAAAQRQHVGQYKRLQEQSAAFPRTKRLMHDQYERWC